LKETILSPEGDTQEKLLTLKDTTGTEVAGVTATGSAEFKELASEKLVVAGATSDTASANEQGEITTNATAGHALLAAKTSEITVKSPAVTDKTLVYITPTTSTKNNVLYVKLTEKGFQVGFIEAIDVDVNLTGGLLE
jgi:hypothetical protein